MARINMEPRRSTPDWEMAVVAQNENKLLAFAVGKTGYFFVKRAMDVLIAIVFIVFVLSWLIPLLAIAIKLSSRGPAFFIQKRVGRGGQSFNCYKLRSMILNAESDKVQAEENDSRITRLGRFLRDTNLDELPQFINVLAGSMSLIGPRPHMPADCSYFASMVPGYKFRNLVKPGITGMAQIKGFHGPAMDYENIFRRYQWDAFYVRNANFLTDIRILHLTILQSTGKLAKKIFSGFYATPSKFNREYGFSLPDGEE